MKLKKSIPWLLLILTIFLAFFKLDASSLHEWDESRRLINAMGMLRYQDYFNYYYLQIHDFWNAKPFLNTWVICMNFILFGVSEFSLRLHSALASVITIMVLYKLIRQYESVTFALLCCYSLLASRAVLGVHLGRTGDQDAMLIMFMILSLYSITAYVDFNKKSGLWLGAVFLGFAFLTKSFVSLLFIPGLLMYTAYRNKLGQLLRNYRVYVAILIYASFVLTYYFLVRIYGYEREFEVYEGNNLWETHIWYDFVMRFIKPGLETNYDPFFAFKSLDIYYSIWIYILYLGGIVIGIWKWKSLKKLKLLFRIHQPNIIYLSAFIAWPILLLFSLSQNQRSWYFAPAFPMIAILTTAVVFWFLRRWRLSLYPVLIIMILTLWLQLNWMAHPETSTREYFYSQSELINSADRVITDAHIPQDHVAYIYMFNRTTFIYDVDEVVPDENVLYYLREDRAKERGMQILSVHAPYCFAKY